MTSELYRDITKNTLPTAAALLVLTIALALSLACGGGGGASPECLDSLGRMDEVSREQLGQPVASMDHAARLATLKALGSNELYELHGESEECGEFVRELEEWEDTDAGQEWHEENGVEIAAVVSSDWGLKECKDVLDYDRAVAYLEDLLGGVNRAAYRVSRPPASYSKSDDYIYEVSQNLQVQEVIVDDNEVWRHEQHLECAVKADVDNRRRTVTNIEVVQGELVQDGRTLSTYPQPQTLAPVPTPTIHLYARLEPDPSTVKFTAEHGLFKTFTVRTSYPMGVRLVLDPGRTLYGIPKLDFGVGDSAPTRSGCPSNTRHTRQLKEGSNIYLEACTYGTTTIQLIPWHREVTNLDAIESYTISIPAPEPTKTPTPEPPDA